MSVQYSATSVLYGATLLPYFLNESQDWGLEVKDLAGQIGHVSTLHSPLPAMAFLLHLHDRASCHVI